MYSLQRISVSFFLVIFCLETLADDPWRSSVGAIGAGMGGACIMRSDFWSSFQNQAGLAYNEHFSAGISYENRFGISDLATRTAAVALPAGRSSVSAVYSGFGNRDFMRHSAGLGCGLKLSEKIAAGVRADYFLEKTTGEYESNDALTFEGGLLIKPSGKVTVGVHLFNPFPGSRRKTFLPTVLRAGTGVFLTGDLFAAAEAEMRTYGRLVLKTGFEYEAAGNLIVRGGFCSENTSFCFGVGYKVSFLNLDLAFRTHDKLGVTSSASMIFILK